MPVAMPVDATTHPINAVAGAQKIRLLTTRFGQGYAQTTPNGTAPTFKTFTVTWYNLTPTAYQTVTTAINSTLGSDYFTWTCPGETSDRKWLIDNTDTEATLYQESVEAAGYVTVSMNIREIP